MLSPGRTAKCTDLGTLGGANSLAYRINDRGQAVGYSETGAGATRHAFLTTDGQMRDLGTVPDLDDSVAYDVNSAGEAVGMAAALFPDAPGTRALLWRGGQTIDLSRLLPPNSGWTLDEARAINDRGQIAGLGHFHGSAPRLPADTTVRQNMITQKIGIGILAGGIFWFAFMLAMPDVVIVPGFGQFHPASNRQDWVNLILGVCCKLPGAALSYLMVLAMISLPVGIYLRLARRRAAFGRPQTPAPHGKYLPWGRNLRRHASIPARYSGLRPRKPRRANRR